MVNGREQQAGNREAAPDTRRDTPSPQATDVAAARLGVREMMMAGSALERSGRFGDALTLYGKVSETAPRDPAVRDSAARAAIAVRAYDVAVEHARAGLTIAPEAHTMRANLVIGLLESGQLAEAEETAHSLTTRRPADAAALNLLGVVQKRRGHWEAAVATLEQATQAHPDNHSVWYNLGNT